jgi:hypothetical protein
LNHEEHEVHEELQSVIKEFTNPQKVKVFVTIQRIAKAKLSQALGVFHPLS